MSSLKFEIETWANALQAYDAEDWDGALELFSQIADTSKILTNVGLIYASLGEHELAIENFHEATSLDSYLAIAYFQAGVSYFLIGQFEAAFEEFEGAFQFLRGNEAINYEQLGLKYQLHACAVMFNQGISLINMGETERGMALLRKASTTKATPDHDVVDDAIQDQGEGYSVFSIPVGVLYRPNEKKVANMKARDWMGKARLISDTDARNEFVPSASTAARTKALLDATPAEMDRPGLTRSKSAAVPRTVPDEESSPPRAAVVARSASAGSRTVNASKAEAPLPDIQPLAISRSKSTRVSPAGGANGAPQPLNPMTLGRRPTLKLNLDSGVEFPPSPPRSGSPQEEERDRATTQPTKSMLRSQYGESIFDNYLTGGDEGASIKGMGFGKSALLRKNTLGSSLLPPLPTRAPSRQNTISKRPTMSDEDEAYLDEERRGSLDWELKRIRIKLFFKDEVRGMVVMPNIPFAELLESVCSKFSYELGGLRMKFADEDGTKVSLRDDGDWEMAVETIRETSSFGGSVVSSAKGEGKLSIWCEEDYQ